MNGKRKKKRIGSDGFTLIEVLTAFVILLMASQVLLLGFSFASKSGARSGEIEMMRRGIGEHLAELSECEYGTVRLDMGGACTDIESDGWMYTGGENEEPPVKFKIIWVEESVVGEQEEDLVTKQLKDVAE